MTQTIKDEFEKAFKKKFEYSEGLMIKIPDQGEYGYALFGAKWMAERCAVKVMGEDLPSTIIRQLAKELQ